MDGEPISKKIGGEATTKTTTIVFYTQNTTNSGPVIPAAIVCLLYCIVPPYEVESSPLRSCVCRGGGNFRDEQKAATHLQTFLRSGVRGDIRRSPDEVFTAPILYPLWYDYVIP